MAHSGLKTNPEGRPAAFLDRDGTVSQEAGYINHPDRIILLPGSAAAIKRLNEAGVLAILTTNQAGLAHDYFTRDVLDQIHGRLQALLTADGARLDAIYYAPSHPRAKIDAYRREDPMRKPGTGMIELACEEFDVDLSRSMVFGDKPTDVELAVNAGIRGVFVLSGYGLGEYEFHRDRWKVEPDHIADDLAAGIDWMLGQIGAEKAAQ